MRTMTPFPSALPLLALLLVAGCGGGEPDAATDEAMAEEQEAPAEQQAPPPAPPPTTSSSAPLSVEDIDRWQRGMEAELKAVQEGGARLAGARTAEDSADVVLSTAEMSTDSVGAAAAGVSEERYQFIGSTLSRAAAFLAPDPPMPGTTPAMQEQLEQGRAKALAEMSDDLPPAVMEALRPRAARLRQHDMTLIGERLKVAGA